MRLELVLFSSMIVFASPLRAAPPVSAPTDPVRAVITEVLSQEGLPIETSGVAVVNEGGHVSVTIDISEAMASYLAEKIAERLAIEKSDLKNVRVDMKVFGSAETAAPEGTLDRAPEWRDALVKRAAAPRGAADNVATGAERSYPENVANFVVAETDEAARLVILKHLEEIREKGYMSERIATDDYWWNVFYAEGYADIYDASRALLKRALRAGLRPYKEGKGLNAKVFSDLAARAIQAPPALASTTIVQP